MKKVYKFIFVLLLSCVSLCSTPVMAGRDLYSLEKKISGDISEKRPTFHGDFGFFEALEYIGSLVNDLELLNSDPEEINYSLSRDKIFNAAMSIVRAESCRNYEHFGAGAEESERVEELLEKLNTLCALLYSPLGSKEMDKLRVLANEIKLVAQLDIFNVYEQQKITEEVEVLLEGAENFYYEQNFFYGFTMVMTTVYTILTIMLVARISKPSL